MKPLALLAVLASTMLLSACNEAREAARPPAARPVLVTEASFAPRERAALLAGVVRARTESDLGFRIAGKVARRLVDAGAIVRAGDPLARLDDTDFRLQLEEAEAEQASAKASERQAGAEEARLTTLARQGWTASAEFDRARAAAEQARASVARAERAVALARNAIDYATLRADADGVISAVLAEPGQVVAVGAPVIRLAHSAELEASVSVPETMVEKARSAPAKAEFWALPGLEIDAKLRELAPSADPATRTYPARFSLFDASPAVRLGMSLTVSLAAGEAQVARLPIAAVFDMGRGPSVWIVAPDGTVSASPVRLAGSDAEFAYVTDGVDEGAKVVSLGVHKLQSGEKVRSVESLAGL